MKINFDRICKLAGVETGSRGTLREGAYKKEGHYGMQHELDYAEGAHVEEDMHKDMIREEDEVVPGFEDPKYDRFSVKDKKEVAEFMKGLPFGEPTSMASLKDAEREANLAAAKKKLEAIRKRVEDEKIVDEFMKGLDFGEPSDLPTKLDEMVEVDINMLMEEIRNVKAALKHRKAKKQRLEENHLKRIIRKEVDSILNEIEEHDSTWVYGNRQPRSSRRGRSAIRSTIPGIGFKR